MNILLKNRLKQGAAIVAIIACALVASRFVQIQATSDPAPPSQDIIDLPGSEDTAQTDPSVAGGLPIEAPVDVAADVPAVAYQKRTLLNAQKLAAAEALSGDMIGTAIALSDDGGFLLVGASGDDAAGTDSGAVYSYQYDNGLWMPGQKITSPAGGQSLTYFGGAADLNAEGSRALIGASGENGDVGAAYVLFRSDGSWHVAARIAAPDGIAGDYFGSQVALSADGLIAVVAAPDAVEGQGAAYVFVDQGGAWMLQARLIASDGGPDDGFGTVLALSDDGTRLLVGAADDKYEIGAAYLFDQAGGAWIQSHKLTASDPAEGDRFGYPLTLSGDGTLALIGAVGDNHYTGAAYSFAFDGLTWAEQQKFTAPDSAGMTSFGSSLAMSRDGSTAVIGAYGTEGTAGGTYVYRRKINNDGLTVWKDWGKLLAPDRSVQDFFGTTSALDASGSRAVIGANGSGDFRGAVYAFFEDSLPTAADSTESNEEGMLELPVIEPGFSTSTDLTPVPTDAPQIVPADPVDPDELLANGQFETEGVSRDAAAVWSVVDGVDQVTRKCPDASELTALDGTASISGCVLQINSEAGKVSIVGQSVDLTGKPVTSGDTLTLTGRLEVKGTAADVRIRVQVSYLEAGLEEDKLVYKTNAATDGYVTFDPQMLVLRGTPQVITVMLINQGLDGKVRFDDLSLKWADTGQAGFSDTTTLPLP